MTQSLPLVEAEPYPWPYDKKWSVEDTVVLAIDFQKDLCSSDGFLAEKGYRSISLDAALANAKKVLNWARASMLPVIYTRQIYHQNLYNLSPVKAAWHERIGLPIGTKGPLGRYLIAGEDGSEIAEPLAPKNDEPIIDRPAINPFLQSDLHNLLLKMGVRNLIVVGSFLEGAVHTAVCAANDRGFEVLLVADACLTTVAKSAETTLETTKLGGGLFGTVTDVKRLGV